MASNSGQGLLVIERILRDRDGVWRQIIEERGLRQLTVQMLGSSAISLALYGAVLGANYGWLQALSSAVKLPLLFLATLMICLPTLYLFNLVFGARLSMFQAVTLIMVSITVTSVLSLAFAPISLFFLISAHSYAFFKLLNVCILMLTALVGLKFLTAGMKALNEHQESRVPALVAHANGGEKSGGAEAPQLALAAATTVEGTHATAATTPVAAEPVAAEPVPQPQPPVHPVHPVHPGRPVPPAPGAQGQKSMTLLYIWILLFGFVGTQLGWTLRPFFGSPGKEFEIFRELDGTFYGDIFATIGSLLGG